MTQADDLNALDLDALEIRHARFNALKTLSTPIESAFEVRPFGPLVASRDAQRPDSYYNRALGFRAGSEHTLAEAIAWVTSVGDGPVRLDVAAGHRRESVLHNAGFGLDSELLWLHRPEGALAMSPDVARVRELSSDDWPSIRGLLEDRFPIDDALWRQRRVHLCTDSFRWFGIFDGGLLVSAATLWTELGAAVFGSAYTRASYRERGHHQELLAARGAAWAGPAVVDVTPNSVSHRNCLRSEFADVELREVWLLTG